MWRLLVAGALGLVVGISGSIFVGTLRSALWQEPDSEIAAPIVFQEMATSSPPERLIIPSLRINAAVQHAGVTEAGTMAAPTYYADVSWFKYGPTPGQNGSAVLAGHVDNGLGLAGVFSKLDEIAVGATIEVRAEDGTVTRFVVRAIERYPYKGAPTADIFRRDGAPQLVLITCGGKWLSTEKTYDERVAVYAEPAPEST